MQVEAAPTTRREAFADPDRIESSRQDVRKRGPHIGPSEPSLGTGRSGSPIDVFDPGIGAQADP
jgi:hypothetical protein